MIEYCPRCGARNTSRKPICATCGQKLYGRLAGSAERVKCLVCAAVVPISAIHCTGCGRR